MGRVSAGSGPPTKPPERSYRPSFSPQGHFNQVPVGLVQAQLRACFECWGMPARLKVDNGSPWGSWSDLPTFLALWLIGLGIEMHWNPPRRPQSNGVVERSHGTAQRWADLASCRSVEELQQRLDREDIVQREEYPYLAGQSRLQAYPELAHSGRPYESERESEVWSWQRVMEHLGGYVMTRQVDASGKFGLYQGKEYVGTKLKGRTVLLQFDADKEQWLISDDKGAELCRRPLTQFDSAALRDLPATVPLPSERFKAKRPIAKLPVGISSPN
jgi:hypothetical protein